ncbi:MAG: precorrin-2 dehydrogenase/sirohydrochlorin ferrochelatase family protein [Chloroflexota bacterium]
MKYYTICLVGLPARLAIVVGGGAVAARKVEGLLAAGAQVRVISPLLVPELQRMADLREIDHAPRPYRDGDLEGASLVIAATDDASVNQSVWREAERRGCLVNVVDDPEHSNFIVPAVVQRGELGIAISTGGNSPALARRMRERIEKLIGPEYGVLAELMGELRPELIASFPDGKERLQAALRVVDSDIIAIIQVHGRNAALAYGREQLYRK